MGEAIVRRLAAAGATVATTARSPLPESQAVEWFVHADISTQKGAAKVVREILHRLGGADILVNNVGGSATLSSSRRRLFSPKRLTDLIVASISG
jgi:NAD(P)-dependent dehydrogenase (short-subunit alcohol dehydrogenase family)